MSQQVLHLDFVSLKPAGSEERERLLEAAAQLAELPQVQALGAIEAEESSQSDFDLVFYFLLPEFTALEPFGTNPRYTGFLQGAVAPRLQAFAGADVRLDADFQAEGAYAGCLALMAPEETYDWEVRAALESWCHDTSASTQVVGLAVGEKQLYRGAALAFGNSQMEAARPAESRLRSTIISGKVRSLA